MLLLRFLVLSVTRATKAVGASLVLVVISGCTSFKPSPLSPVRSVAEWDARNLNDSGLRAFIRSGAGAMGVKGEGWGLGRLTLAAVYFQPDLDVSRAELEAAQASRISAAERPNPVLNLLPGYDTTAHGISPWIPFASVDVPVETAGKRGIRMDQAARKAAAARWKLAATAWEVRSRVRKALVALHSAEQAEALLQSQEKLQGDTMRLLDEQRKAGEVSPLLASQARISLSQTQLSMHDAQRQVVSARAQIAQAVGISARALDGVMLDFTELDHAPATVGSASARRRALTSRADILASLSEYAVAEQELRLQVAKQYPDVHLAPGYQLDQTDNKWTLGVTFELPVLNQNKGKIAEADAARKVAAMKFRQVQAKALGEIDLAVVNYRGAREKAEAAQRLLQDQQAQVKSTEQLKQAGAIGLLELTQRQLEANTAALAHLDAEIKASEALGDLEDALQAPTTLPEPVWSRRTQKP